MKHSKYQVKHLDIHSFSGADPSLLPHVKLGSAGEVVIIENHKQINNGGDSIVSVDCQTETLQTTQGSYSFKEHLYSIIEECKESMYGCDYLDCIVIKKEDYDEQALTDMLSLPDYEDFMVAVVIKLENTITVTVHGGYLEHPQLKNAVFGGCSFNDSCVTDCMMGSGKYNKGFKFADREERSDHHELWEEFVDDRGNLSKKKHREICDAFFLDFHDFIGYAGW